MAAAAVDAHGPVTPREKRAWYVWDFGSHATSSVVISGFLPLIVQEVAQAAAGFPGICPNVQAGAAAVEAVFPNGTAPAGTEAVYLYNEPDLSLISGECVAGASIGSVTGTWCAGWPSTIDECVYASGDPSAKFPVRVGGWDPAAYSNAMVSVAVGLQMLVFVQAGAVADHGKHRKTLWALASVLTIALDLLILTIGPLDWQLAGFFAVIVAIVYNTSLMLYNSFLPLLASNLPEVLHAAAPGVEGGEAAPAAAAALVTSSSTDPDAAAKAPSAVPAAAASAVAPPSPASASAEDRYRSALDKMSAQGFVWAYGGAVCCLILSVVIAVALKGSLLSYKIDCALAGVFWLVTLWYPFRHLKARPGPPLPAGESYITLPWKRLAGIVRQASQLRVTLSFLLLWAVYADAFNVLGYVGATYANTSVVWKPIPKSLGLSAMLLITPLAGVTGAAFFNWLAKRHALSARTLVVINLLLLCLVPGYGLLGYANPEIGYRRGWEMFLGVLVYGFNLGSIQAFSRSAYAMLIPEGLETSLYALYAFVDRGSSFIGPAVVAASIQATGSIRVSFIFPLVCMAVPAGLLLLVDMSKGAAEAKQYAKRNNTAKIAMRGALSLAVADIEPIGAAAISAGSPLTSIGDTPPMAGSEGRGKGDLVMRLPLMEAEAVEDGAFCSSSGQAAVSLRVADAPPSR